jgi:hypothetical protein
MVKAFKPPALGVGAAVEDAGEGREVTEVAAAEAEVVVEVVLVTVAVVVLVSVITTSLSGVTAAGVVSAVADDADAGEGEEIGMAEGRLSVWEGEIRLVVDRGTILIGDVLAAGSTTVGELSSRSMICGVVPVNFDEC